jgi:hypothetical protein
MGFSIKGALGGLLVGAVTGNPMLGMATYSGISSSEAQSKAGKQQKRGQQKAIDAQLQVNRENIEFQKELFGKQQELQKPWREKGLEALQKYSQSPDFEFDSKTFNFGEDDPSYQFRLQEGQRALERGASARGNVLAGGTDRGLVQYGQGMASQEYGNAFNRFQQSEAQRYQQERGVYDANQNKQINMMNMGMGATAQTQQAQNTMGSNVSGSMIRSGNAMSQGYQNIGNMGANATIGQQKAQNQLLGNAMYLYQKGL